MANGQNSVESKLEVEKYRNKLETELKDSIAIPVLTASRRLMW